jgi:transcriptional regulator with XRE-family HTH domain
VTDVGAYLREQRESARLSVRQLASLAGVSNPYLSQVERGLRNPSAEVLQQIAKGLRISAEALYVRAGILDEELRVGVDRAVHSDPELSDRQKRVLLDIYASFRAENARAAAEDVAASVPRRRPSTRTTSSVPTTASKRAARKAAASTAEERPVRPRRRAKAAATSAETAAAPADAATGAGSTGSAAPDVTSGRTAKRATKRSTSKRVSKRASTRSAAPAPEAAPTDTH